MRRVARVMAKPPIALALDKARPFAASRSPYRARRRITHSQHVCPVNNISWDAIRYCPVSYVRDILMPVLTHGDSV